MEKQLSDWLHDVNLQMSREGIHYKRRPFEAFRLLSEQKNIDIIIPSPLANELFDWFYAHSPVGSHAIGSLFTSVLYYDAYFWRLEVPVAYGIVQINALDQLSQMPLSVKEQLQSDRAMMWRFICLWVDSMDYGFGIDDLGYGKRLPQQGNREFAVQLVNNAHNTLCACVQLLAESPTPNLKSIESARMATEMFLKAYLAIHSDLGPKDAQKKFGHNLEKLVSACKFGHGMTDFDDLAQHLSMYPPIGARYEGLGYAPEQLWACFALALRTGVTFTRSLTDRDNRAQILCKQC